MGLERSLPNPLEYPANLDRHILPRAGDHQLVGPPHRAAAQIDALLYRNTAALCLKPPAVAVRQLQQNAAALRGGNADVGMDVKPDRVVDWIARTWPRRQL